MQVSQPIRDLLLKRVHVLTVPTRCFCKTWTQMPKIRAYSFLKEANKWVNSVTWLDLQEKTSFVVNALENVPTLR